MTRQKSESILSYGEIF